MEDVKQRLQRLMGKAEWTEEEKEWLLNYLDNPGSSGLQELLEGDFLEKPFSEHLLNKDASERILRSIHDKIGVGNSSRKTPVFFMLQRKIMVAAAVLACLVAGTYLAVTYNRQQHVPSGISQQKVAPDRHSGEDIAPGGNKAVLTLADGSTIVLDDAHNGTVAQQGKTKISKLDGRLAYNSSSGGTEEVLFNSVITPRGGEYQVMLPDGSEVWLNAASSIRFPTVFKGPERRVEITGEAYFEVAKNAAVPFIVNVNSSEVKVMGTHFNIMAYKDEGSVRTTLLEGSVQFNHEGSTTILKPGQQSRSTPGEEIQVLNHIDPDDAVAWKNGMFHFNKTDVESMMRQLARWYDIEVIFASGYKTRDKFIADIPRNTNLSQALQALELTDKINFEIKGKTVTVK
jgi:transmembrane sensor